MKKKYWILIIISLILLSLLTYKKKKGYNKYATIKIDNKSFNFGKVKINDTINHTFTIKNISEIPFLVNKVLPSCMCTVAGASKKIIRKNEFLKIKVQFIAYEHLPTSVSSIILIEGNAENGIVKLELKGEISK